MLTPCRALEQCLSKPCYKLVDQSNHFLSADSSPPWFYFSHHSQVKGTRSGIGRSPQCKKLQNCTLTLHKTLGLRGLWETCVYSLWQWRIYDEFMNSGCGNYICMYAL